MLFQSRRYGCFGAFHVAGEQIKVGTWPYEFGRMTGRRNFRLLDNQGKMAAYADSEWVLMDTERMRPTKIEESLSGAYTLEPGLDMGSEEGKISLPEQMESRDAFEVHEYHLDVNRHVNNGQYVQMAADYLPEETKIHEMRAKLSTAVRKYWAVWIRIS